MVAKTRGISDRVDRDSDERSHKSRKKKKEEMAKEIEGIVNRRLAEIHNENWLLLLDSLGWHERSTRAIQLKKELDEVSALYTKYRGYCQDCMDE